MRFIPVPSNLASEGGCEYGFRIKLRTSRKKVRVYRTFNYWVKVWVEDTQLPTLNYRLKY